MYLSCLFFFLLFLCFFFVFFFFQAEDGIRDRDVTGVQTCALPSPAVVLGFVCVTTQYPRPAWGILTSFPFDRRISPKIDHLETDFSYLLGLGNPRSIAVLVEPFSTSVFKVLIWIFATATKICTKGRFTLAHATSCTTTFTSSYSSDHRTWSDGWV